MWAGRKYTPEFYGKARRSFKIGMITTVDPSDGEDMYVDSTDAESPPRVEGPPKEESEEEPRVEKKQNTGKVWKTKMRKTNPQPQNIIPRMRTISPARRANCGEAEFGDH